MSEEHEMTKECEGNLKQQRRVNHSTTWNSEEVSAFQFLIKFYFSFDAVCIQKFNVCRVVGKKKH